jgi:hypothetical protein
VRTDAPPRPCPRCGSTDAIRIIYGLPDHELFEASERGEVALGGCVIGDESPDFECRACGAALPFVADPSERGTGRVHPERR